MKKTIILLALFCISAFSCALCALQVPTAHVTLKFTTEDSNLTNIHVKWEFSPNFTSQLYSGYDLNENQKFEENERQEIKTTLIDYIAPKHYLAFVAYYDVPYNELDQEKDLPIHPKNQKLITKGGQIFFEFDLPQNLLLKKGRVLKTEFMDDEGYFNFMILNEKPQKIGDLTIEPNINLSSGFFEIKQENKKADVVKKKPAKKDIRKVLKPKQTELNGFYAYLSSKLTYYTNKIKQMFKKSKDNTYALFYLMIFSFFYGLFHAAGPGHGKMLVGSYFLANGGSYMKAFWLCLKIGFVHVIGAFALVFVSVYVIKTFISQVVSDVTRYTTLLSAVFILALAFYLIYKKIVGGGESKCSCSTCQGEVKNAKQNALSPNIKSFDTGTAHNWKPTGNSEKHKKKQEWGIALAAGLVPCPGTVAIFILAFTFGNYLSGFLSAFALALGMSAVIFVVSVFGNFVHQKVSSSLNSFLSQVEYFGLSVLAILGIIMLVSAF